MAGKLIFIEGVNGAGKSTQIKLLQEAYRNVLFTKEPFRLDANCLNFLPTDDPLELAFLMAADRAAHMRNLIPELEYFDVICDRGPLSTMAYQGTALRDFFNWDKRAMPAWSFLWTVNEWAMRGIPVAATIVLTVPPEVAVKRVKLRAKSIGESCPKKYLEDLKRAADWYHNSAFGQSAGAWVGEPYHVDANRPINEVFADVDTIIKNTLAS